MYRILASLPLLLAFVGSGCGGGGVKGPCEPDGPACANDMVCEAIAGGSEHHCFLPVLVEGQVFNLETSAPVEGARVVALDPSGGAISGIVTTDGDGNYSLPVPATRDADGVVQAASITLRVSAAHYETFPKAPRNPLPIDLTAGAEEANKGWIVSNAATNVGLLPYQGATPVDQLGKISGKIEGGDAAGALVVAEAGGTAVSTAIANQDGSFVLFNIPPGETLVDGYKQGLNVEEQTVAVGAGEAVADVILLGSVEGVGRVFGSVNFVAGGSPPSSVILVVESTFISDADQVFVRGEMPNGLRAEVTDNWEITGVPPGSYAVLCAFENDDNVRDPNEGTAGTGIPHITVNGDFEVTYQFKITDAITLNGPGVNGIETVNALPVNVSWQAYPSTATYEVRIYDSYGALVHTATTASTSYSWDGTYDDGNAAVAGNVYQARIISIHSTGTFLSTSEDLRGTFLYQP